MIFLLAGALSLSAADLNSLVLQQIAAMPRGGGYATTRDAHQALLSCVVIGEQKTAINPARAQPSYCSGATYLVFLKTLQQLEAGGALRLDRGTWAALQPLPMADGQGLWGRWNANGPGTARLFYQLGLGKNFSDFAEARPGDFMKIFWTDAVGQNERGHSVVYLGTEQRDGVEYVRFWSSNKPAGFGEKSVARSKIARAIFSRLEHPERVTQWAGLAPKDTYLASLLSTDSSIAEAKRLTGTHD